MPANQIRIPGDLPQSVVLYIETAHHLQANQMIAKNLEIIQKYMQFTIRHSYIYHSYYKTERMSSGMFIPACPSINL